MPTRIAVVWFNGNDNNNYPVLAINVYDILSYAPSAGIKGSFFCNQACFKASWSTHKSVHKSANSTNNENDKPYNPWPHFHFTGKLRPGRVSPKRAVPAHIERPDYADHPEGVPISEQAMRGAEIKVLSEVRDLAKRFLRLCAYPTGLQRLDSLEVQ